MSAEAVLALYFIYGLTFFSLGLVMLLESWRLEPGAPQVHLLRPLAAFGLLHGFHEWLELLILEDARLGTHLPPRWVWLRLALLGLSFAALAWYAWRSIDYAGRHLTALSWIGVLGLAIFSVLAGIDAAWSSSHAAVEPGRLAESLVRYGLGVTSAAVASLGLLASARKARADDRRPLDSHLLVTAAGFAVYSLTQLVTPNSGSLLGSLLNTDLFLTRTGIPIQVVRTVVALLITTGLVGATRFLERERQAQHMRAQKAQLEALALQETLQRELARHVVQAQEQERARIARELHDELAQLVTGLALEVAALERGLQDHAIHRPVIQRLRALSRQLSSDVLGMVSDLRPAVLDDLGLPAGLRALADTAGPRLALDVSLAIEGTPRRLGPGLETALYRIAQEALTNVARHAGTSAVRMRLEYAPESARLAVSDQGAGFDPDRLRSHPPAFGLLGMRERAAAAGGVLNLDSRPGGGTCVEAVLPAPVEAEA